MASEKSFYHIVKMAFGQRRKMLRNPLKPYFTPAQLEDPIFMKRAENVAKESGYVKTQIGRRLRFPRGQGAHKAAGFLYQAYAADIHKAGLIMVDAAIREMGLPARLMLSVHDEIGVSMPMDDDVKNVIVKNYTNFNGEDSPIQMRVPIAASADYGVNWYEASKN